MSIYRRSFFVCHVFSLGSLGLLSLACASGPTSAPVRPAVPEGPQAVELEPMPAGPEAAPAASLYAPKRDSNGLHYSWQSARPVKCAPDAKPAVLSFNGSVGVFPLLSDEELEQAQRAADAQADAASAPPPARDPRISSPDSVVALLRPRFRHCFAHWLDAKADAEGSVRFALELGCAGNVQAISAEVRGVDHATLACLFTVIGPAQFEPPSNGRATIQIPVVFKNAAR